ncbi:MAG: YihY/virulence factor BrkB family protein [Thiothrix sp.]|nr:YihY/virulence factor BrkB family protein [Thiothrix sp.]
MLHKIRQILWQTLELFMQNHCFESGAALAFYAMLSLAPVLIILLAITGYFFGDEAAHAEILRELGRVMGTDKAEVLLGIVRSAALPDQSAMLDFLTALGLLFAATGMFGTLELSLHRIWKTEVTLHFFWQLALTRLRAFILLAVIGVLLIFIHLLNGLIELALHYVSFLFAPYENDLVARINSLIYYLFSALLFAFIFRLMSGAGPGLFQVLAGGIFTALLFGAGKYFITLYLSKSFVISSYGAASTFVAILFWAYYSGVILLLGGCFTRALALPEGGSVDDEE